MSALSRRDLLRSGAAGLGIAAVPRISHGAASVPNVMVVFLGGVGAQTARVGAATPHLDRLTAESTSWTQAFTADPAPGPALTSLLTGRPSAEHGVVMDGLPLDPAHPELGAWAAQHGISTHWAGAWPIPGREARAGWSRLIGGGDDLRTVGVVRAFLGQRSTSRPWLLGVRLDAGASVRQHRGRHGASGVLELGLKPEELPLPPKRLTPPDALPAGFVEARAPSLPSEDNARQDTWMLARSLEATDARLGALVDALAHSAHDARTLLVVVGEHGDAASAWGIQGGSAPLMSVLKVPLLFRWGTVRTPRSTDVAVSTTCLAGTLCRVLQIPQLPHAADFDLRTPVEHADAPVPEAIHCDLMVDGHVVIAKEGTLLSWRSPDGPPAQLARQPDGEWVAPGEFDGLEALEALRLARADTLQPAGVHRGGLSGLRAASQAAAQ